MNYILYPYPSTTADWLPQKKGCKWASVDLVAGWHQKETGTDILKDRIRKQAQRRPGNWPVCNQTDTPIELSFQETDTAIRGYFVCSHCRPKGNTIYG